MQRLAVARLGARLVPRSRSITTPQQLSRRWLSESQAPRSASSQPGILVWGTAAAVAAGGGYFLFNGSTANKTAAVPLLNTVSSEDDIPVVSPLPVLDLKAADQKLREQAQSFVFDGKDGQKGRVDVVRVASNDPVEDEWSVAVGKGIQGRTALYAGVYDGHAYARS
jgi:pyruvate dehydrogenase phosphatase